VEKLRALVRFLPDLEKPDFNAGSWISPETGPDGVFVLPYTDHSEVVTAFVEMAYQNGWVLTNFDWPKWAQTKEASRLRDNERALSRATSDQLAKLLTVCIRQDRFVEGALLGAFESGLILRIVRRAAELLNADQVN